MPPFGKKNELTMESKLVETLDKLGERLDAMQKSQTQLQNSLPELVNTNVSQAIRAMGEGIGARLAPQERIPEVSSEDIDGMSNTELMEHMQNKVVKPVQDSVEQTKVDARLEGMKRDFEQLVHSQPEAAFWGNEILKVAESSVAEGNNLSAEQMYILAKGSASAERREEVANQMRRESNDEEGDGEEDPGPITFYPNRVAESPSDDGYADEKEAGISAYREVFGNVKDITQQVNNRG